MTRTILAALVAAAAGAAVVAHYHAGRVSTLLAVIDDADRRLSDANEAVDQWASSYRELCDTQSQDARREHEAWESNDEFVRELIEANAGMGEALTDIAASLGMPLGQGGPPPWRAADVAQVAAFLADDEGRR